MLKYRINRATYWLCFGIVAVGLGLLIYLGQLKGGLEVAMVVVGVPRLHDIGRSGWLVGAAIGAEILIVAGLLVAGASVDTIEVSGGLIVLGIAILGIWLGIVRGQPIANKWGEPPNAGIQFGGRKPTA